jgi:hypothetical protein
MSAQTDVTSVRNRVTGAEDCANARGRWSYRLHPPNMVYRHLNPPPSLIE